MQPLMAQQRSDPILIRTFYHAPLGHYHINQFSGRHIQCQLPLGFQQSVLRVKIVGVFQVRSKAELEATTMNRNP